MSPQIVEPAALESKMDVLRVFDALEWDVRRLVRRQLRGTPHCEEAVRIATEIVVLVRSRWDGAGSLSSWHEGARPQGWASVTRNALYERLRDLGVDSWTLLDALRRAYTWLERPFINRGRSLKQSTAVVATNNLKIPGAEIVPTYLRRWATERASEAWKGPLAGMDYHSTNLDSIETFMWIGFPAHTLAARARQILAPGCGLPTLLARRRRATQTIAATDFRRSPALETMTRKAA